MKKILSFEVWFKTVVSIFLIIFIPTLFCVLIFGNKMDYNPIVKLITLYSNRVLFAMGVPVLVMFLLFIHFAGKVKITKKISFIMDIGLGVLFVGLFFVNWEICKCLHMAQGWDVSCVVGTAYELHKGIPIGDETYYSLYPNNVPITFVLYKLFSFADSIKGFPYVNDFMWFMVICALVSLAGYLTCMCVKKITESFAVTIITFILYVGCLGISPWKTVPYTDMFAILFPILSINTYVLGCCSKRKWQKYMFWFLSFLAGFFGSLIKPTVLIVSIAILICEVLKLVVTIKKSWKELVIKLALVFATVLLYLGAKSYIYKDVGYEQDKEVQFTALHFMMMGLNEKTTGSYDGWDVAISGNVPLLKDRTQKQLEVIEERLKEKGFFGYMNFLLKKNVMTFNDGTFGWGREGAYTYSVYPVYSDGEYAHFVQKIFLPDLEYEKQFKTYSQFVWLLIIFCIPGICLVKKEKRELCLPIMVAFVGIVLYLMLFEARARYLICFSPVLILISGIGLGQYYETISKYCKKQTS